MDEPENDELEKLSPTPIVRAAGPISAVRTLGAARDAAANDAGDTMADLNPPPPPPPPQPRGPGSADMGDWDDEEDDKPRGGLSLSPSSWFGARELPPARQGESYERLTLRASGGAEPYKFKVKSSFADLLETTRRLPPGLKLSEDGIISGTPTRGGGYRFKVAVEDAEGRTGEQEYMISVRLELSRYRAYFDHAAGEPARAADRRISDFDPNETDERDQPILPLSLCEFLAYKSAQAYLSDNPLDPRNNLRRQLERAHPDGEITHLAYFDSNRPLRRYSESSLASRESAPLNKAPDHWDDFGSAKIDRLNEWRAGLDAQGFGFVFEGRAYIVFRGTTSIRDWRVDVDSGLTTEEPRPNSWWENVKFRLGLRGKRVSLTEIEKTLIGGPDPERYLKPARAIGFATAWAALRDPIENWLTSVPEKCRQEFVFSGHSLGGAMALVGAQEFSEKKGRKIHAVVTFGAPCVGQSAKDAGDAQASGDHFVENYRLLQDGELARRTLRVETSSDAVPKLLQFKNFSHVGRPWEIEFPPLPSPFALFARRYLSGPFLWLARGSLGYEIRGLRDIPRKALGYVAFYGIPFLSHAIGSHNAYGRYAGFLSTLSYRKIREARLGDLENDVTLADLERREDGGLDRYFLANALFDQHLKRIYGPRPMRKIRPRYVRSPQEEKRLAERYYCADQAKYIF